MEKRNVRDRPLRAVVALHEGCRADHDLVSRVAAVQIRQGLKRAWWAAVLDELPDCFIVSNASKLRSARGRVRRRRGSLSIFAASSAVESPAAMVAAAPTAAVESVIALKKETARFI